MAQFRGLFPFPYAQPAEGGGVICLNSGGTWYPPAGEWLLTTPANCCMQWWNPIQQSWMDYISASNNADYFSTDGTNYRMLNLTGIVQVASFTAGSGGTNGIGFAATGAAVTFSASGADGVTAIGYVIVGGSVQAPTVTQAGTGYQVPPLVVIDAPPVGGIQATAYATLNAIPTASAPAGILSITMSNVGAGYAASPNFYLIPQYQYYAGGPSGGVVAAPYPPGGFVYPTNAVPGNQNTSTNAVTTSATFATLLTSLALTGSGTVTGVVMINNGALYTGTPTGTITGVGAATVTVSAVTAAAITNAFVQPRVQ